MTLNDPTFVTIASFALFLAGFAALGIFSSRFKQDHNTDYLLASRDVPAWLTALSSMATNNSGYAFIGLVSYAYTSGFSTIWLSIAWVLGDTFAWIWVHKRVRDYSEEVDAHSVPNLLAVGDQGKVQTVAFAAGALTFVFLGTYAAAQLKAGSAALTALFGWAPWIGAVLGFVIVVAYCFSGGLRASIWTDAAQSFVMMFGMFALLTIAYIEVGGIQGLRESLAAIDPELAAIYPPSASKGFILYFLGFVAGGFGCIGAPHILIRSMALRSSDAFKQTRRIYLATFVPFVLASAFIGLYARVMIPELSQVAAGLGSDEASLALATQSEMALPMLAVKTLPNFFVGMILAAIFAATMSTADSQVLSCSAAVTQDMMPRWSNSYMASKLATLAVATLALTIALFAGKGVFALVLDAWAALGCTLGPVLLVRLIDRHVPAKLALLMMATGLAMVYLWPLTGLGGAIYVMLPGMGASLLVYAVARMIR